MPCQCPAMAMITTGLSVVMATNTVQSAAVGMGNVGIHDQSEHLREDDRDHQSRRLRSAVDDLCVNAGVKVHHWPA